MTAIEVWLLLIEIFGSDRTFLQLEDVMKVFNENMQAIYETAEVKAGGIEPLTGNVELSLK